MAKIISSVRKAVSLPVSVKIRIGFNQDSASHLEISQMVHGSQKLSRWRSGLGKAVREVDIPDSVTEVKTYAFDGCD